MKNWLGFIWPTPKKARIILAVFAFLVLIGAVSATFYRKDKEPQKVPDTTVSVRSEQLQKLNRDSDNDGLKDWEEIIYQTDPNKPDTDGDGAKDGEEISNGRDPIKPGPDDLLAAESLKLSPLDSSQYFSRGNLTGSLAEKLGINVIVPRLSDSETPLDIDRIGGLIADEITTEKMAPYFSLKDVKTSQDNSQQAFEKYGRDLMTALATFDFAARSPLEILADALAQENFSSLSSLDQYIKAYGETVDRMKKIQTPSRLASFHYKYMNIVWNQKEAVEKIRSGDKDVVGAVVGAGKFAENFNKLASLAESYQYVSPQ